MGGDPKALLLKYKSSIPIFVGFIIFVVVIFLIVAPTKTITYDIEVPYSTTETYNEKEPYDVQEPYQEQVPYQTTETYTDTVPVPVSVPYLDYEYSYQNSDAGTDQYFSSIPSGCTCTATRYRYDSGGTYGALCVQLSCLVYTTVTKYRTEYQQQTIQKERPVTKYQTVTKYRTVTQYRDVQKTRDVIKIRTEQRQAEANWLFGFRTPFPLHLPFISGN